LIFDSISHNIDTIEFVIYIVTSGQFNIYTGAFVLYIVLCGTQLVDSLAACFHVVMSCVNTWLMSFLISCVFMSCFAHGW